MENQRLGRTLRELPRERAKDDFTARVLARLDAPRRRRRLPLATLGAAAAAALGLALIAGPLRTAEREESRRQAAAEARRLLEELRRDHQALATELEALAEEPPLIYLGGDDEVDLVLDLSRVPAAPPGAVRGAASAGERTPRP